MGNSCRPELATICAVGLFALPARGTVLFSEQAATVGIVHRWGDDTFLNDFGGGVAVDDLDRDGDLDILLATKMPGELKAFARERDRYVDATERFGLSRQIGVKQILPCDLDDDGWRDLLLVRWGAPPKLFRNAGGRFEDLSEGSGLHREAAESWGTGAAAGDIDRDGDLDLYICYWKEGLVGPQATNGLYRNDGEFRFVDMAAQLGVDSQKKSYQPLLTDLNGDGWLDILVAQDKSGGLDYWQSDGAGGFAHASESSGLTGIESNSFTAIDGMGIALGDFDGNLLPDLYVTNIEPGNVLYRAVGDGLFEEVAVPSGTLMQRVGWGTDFLDADNDGRLDLFVGNFSPPERDALFHNLGDATFVNVGPEAGVAKRRATLGVATGDLDGDGRVDVITSHRGGDTQLFLNQSDSHAHWIQVALEGRISNRDGVGATVLVTTPAGTQRRDRVAGMSYLSSSSPWLHFGLAAESMCTTVEIRWPSGQLDRHENVPANHIYYATEGEALVARSTVGTSRAPTVTSIHLRGPNPHVLGLAPVELCVESNAVLSLAIVDARGRVVSLLQTTRRESELQCASWNSIGRGERRVAAGAYHAFVRGDSRIQGASFTILR